MCGICGHVASSELINKTSIEKMTSELSRRGPDFQGSFYKEIDDCKIGFGHARLSIIDLNAHANQPFVYNEYILTFNGEIYNYKEIRQNLISLGYTFHTDSDTEVVIKAYDLWGANALDKFNGMFAFSIHNSENNTLFLARDRAGIKPLYYHWDGRNFIFASELKSILKSNVFVKKISKEGLHDYMKYGFIHEPLSIYENCFKLKQGHYLTLDIYGKNVDIKQYWDVENLYKSGLGDKFDVVTDTKLKNLLSDSFNLRMVSDVPVGLFLSGGYDSSYVLGLLKKNNPDIDITTFTIGFEEEEFNESEDANNIAGYLNIKNKQKVFKGSDALNLINIIPEVYDEPFSDKSLFPTLILSEFASKHVKVALSADGGDELFGGYSYYNSLLKKQKQLSRIPSLLSRLNFSWYRNVKYKDFGSRLTRFLLSLPMDISQLQDLSRQIFIDQDLLSLISVEKTKTKLFQNDDPINTMLCNDYSFYQSSNICVKVDRATMYYGLEAREPLIDYRLVEYLSGFSGGSKIVNGSLKHILKTYCHKIIPPKFIDKPKKGFSMPRDKYLRSTLRPTVDLYFSEDYINEQGLFNIKEISNIYDRYYIKKEKEYLNKIWNLFIFQVWHEKWFNNAS